MKGVSTAVKAAPYQATNKVRFVTATALFDGHDASVNIMRRVLQASGAEVIHLGHNRSVQEIVNAALQEDVQVIGLSILSGAHNAIVPRVMELLREKDMADVKVIVGGIIPDEDAVELKRQGVSAVFQPGASLEGIVDFIRASVPA